MVTLAKSAPRRLMIPGAIMLGGLAMVGLGAGVGPQRASTEGKAAELASASISIHQEADFKASPQRVYEALLDAKEFSAFSGLPAEIRREAGGDFSCFGGHIVGRNVELVPNERVVQAWRVVGWEPGVYSIAKFELKEQGSETRLIFDHTGFPNGKAEHLAAGWKENYWEPLEKYLASQCG